MVKCEAKFEKKFSKFVLYKKDGNEEAVAPHRMTLTEALKYYKALAVKGVE